MTSNWQPEGFNTTWPVEPEERASLVQAVDLCRRFVARAECHAEAVRASREGTGPLAPIHPLGAGWLTLSGAFGCGKTRLAETVFRHLLKVDPFASGPWVAGSGTYSATERRPECVWLHVNQFIDSTLGGSYTYPEWLGRDWLVVIDDLGASRQGGENARESANDAILRLCAARQGKLTIWTTNWTISEIATRIDGRVASRLVRDGDGNRFHRITAMDYAMRKKR